jgi:hypothetical protein
MPCEIRRQARVHQTVEVREQAVGVGNDPSCQPVALFLGQVRQEKGKNSIFGRSQADSAGSWLTSRSSHALA